MTPTGELKEALDYAEAEVRKWPSYLINKEVREALDRLEKRRRIESTKAVDAAADVPIK